MLSLKQVLVLLCVAAISACATPRPPAAQLPNATLSQAGVLAQAKADVAVLASDSLEGRGYVFGGADRAARYLRNRFESIGLQPVGGGYYQPFSFKTDLILETPSLAINGRALKIGRDFLPFPSTASGHAEGIANVVRAGSGVVLPGASTYGGPTQSVQGAVVVLDEDVPDSVRALARNQPEILTEAGRVKAAAERGAAAAVFLTDGLVYGELAPNTAIPAFYALRSVWPDQVQSVSFDVHSIRDTTVRTQNVLGWLPGTAVPDSFIVITAHYDHLGALGQAAYFPGANDNASGVALLLALAETLREQPLRYSVLFVAFSGEEVGLLGSRYFVEYPPLDLDRAVFLLNFDMVASGEQGIVAEGGEDFPDRYRTLQRIASGIDGLTLAPRRNAPNSDQFFLIRRGVPGFYLYTNRGKQPYHSIADVPETLEWDDFFQVYELASAFLQRIGDP